MLDIVLQQRAIVLPSSYKTNGGLRMCLASRSTQEEAFLDEDGHPSLHEREEGTERFEVGGRGGGGVFLRRSVRDGFI